MVVADRSGLGRALPSLLGVGLFGVALVVLRRELHAHSLGEVVAAVRGIAAGRIGVAAVLTVGSYATLIGYDTVALRFVGARLHLARTALASFIGYVVSHTVGAAFVSGAAMRYRIYATFGVSTSDVGRILAFNAATFWLGVAASLGGALLLRPDGAAVAGVPLVGRGLGIGLLALVAGWVAWCAHRRAPLRIRSFEIALPPPAMAVVQVALGTVDWVLAAAVLAVLLPAAAVGSPAGFVAVFVLAQVAGVTSTVPAGLGVFEGVMLVALGGRAPAPVILGALLVYRLVYYLAPLLVAVALLGGFELAERRATLARARRAVGRWVSPLAPGALAVATFVAGVVLLVSGATPPAGDRVAWLRELLPLGAIETSHLAGSVVGVALLLLARGLQRRLDTAWLLAVILLAVGIVASLAKGFDWEEAVVLALVLGALLPCRREFYRRSGLLDEPLSGRWLAAIVLVAVGITWVLLFAYRHVEYSHELWWQFELEAHAPRALRASVAAALLLVLYGCARLLRHAPAPDEEPAPDEAAAVAAIVAASPHTSAQLATVGDKRFVVTPNRRAFVMYAVSGRAWVAMGDPVGPAADARDAAWRFHELADRHGGLTVFYEVGTALLPVYLDLGLTLLKLGEEARVPLAGFSIEGGSAKTLRQTCRRVAREGCTFAVLPAAEVPALLPAMRAVSDAWLADKQTREKRFSLGAFDPAYLARFPVAVVRRAGELLAFANVWQSAAHEELSVDLMRHRPDGPPGLMDFLFVELALWGRAEGWAWMNLGMAPLAGLEERALAPLWSRAGAFLFRHGEQFYNFDGLRRYKAKFEPVWSPRYLACPSALRLPEVLVDVAALVSGGMAGVFRK